MFLNYFINRQPSSPQLGKDDAVGVLLVNYPDRGPESDFLTFRSVLGIRVSIRFCSYLVQYHL